MADAADEWEICNDHGFVFKCRRGLHPDDDTDDAAAPSAPGPSPEAVLLKRRRTALRRHRSRLREELAAWDSLFSEVLAQLPAPPPAPPAPAPAAAAAASAPASSSSRDAAVVDVLNTQAEAHAVMFKKFSEVSDKIKELRSTQQAALVDSFAELPVWGDPRQLMASLGNLDEHDVQL